MSTKGPDGLCTDCGCTHDYWHAENPAEWSYREGCLCHLCQKAAKSNDPRDTQFQGFAKALLDEILQAEIGRVKSTYWRERVESIIARRAYDLAKHVWDETVSSYDTVALKDIPDMAELPKEQA